ncbi:nucleoside hydrolase [Nanoarchaeota archaeon]
MKTTQKYKLMIDSDPFSDGDDLFAIGYAARHPDINLKSLTTVHGKAKARAQMLEYIRRQIPLNGTKIAAGYSKLYQNTQGKIYWNGWEGRELIKKSQNKKVNTDAVKLLDQFSQDAILAAIAPLTNIAYAVNKYQIQNKVESLYIMGDSYESHNLKVDKAATDVVLGADWKNVTLIPTKLSKQVKIFGLHLQDLAKIDKFGETCYLQSRNWLNNMSFNYQYLYDPVTIVAITNPELFEFKNFSTNTRVVTNLDIEKVKQTILQTIWGDKNGQ